VGNPGHPEVIDACLQVIAASKRQGKLCAVGGLADARQIQQLLAAGAAPLVFAAIDTDLLSAGLGTWFEPPERALDRAPPGIIDPRSWAYWNSKMGRYPAPPLPKRRFGEGDSAIVPGVT
jgi:hypothetical protein